MCGIVGIFDSKEPVDRDLLKRMTDVLSHRGPDREGFFIHKSRRMGLGFRRLSIIDLLKGNQPLTNEDDSIHLVFNGEIYNFQEMRKELKTCGHRFKTDSDTECIVHGYEEYGDKVFSKLNGMFAIGLWDEGKGPEKNRFTISLMAGHLFLLPSSNPLCCIRQSIKPLIGEPLTNIFPMVLSRPLRAYTGRLRKSNRETTLCLKTIKSNITPIGS